MASAIVLAAGLSSRMEYNKLLLPLNGSTVLESTIKALLGSNVERIVVVLGRGRESFEKILMKYPVETAFNDKFANGQSTSVKAGVLSAGDGEDLLFCMGDQPLITSEGINKILEKLSEQKTMIVPVYKGEKGSPVLFSSKWSNMLRSLEGDKGGRLIMLEHPEEVEYVEIDDPDFFLDADTYEDYLKIMERANERH